MCDHELPRFTSAFEKKILIKFKSAESPSMCWASANVNEESGLLPSCLVDLEIQSGSRKAGNTIFVTAKSEVRRKDFKVVRAFDRQFGSLTLINFRSSV